jgi:hypothetical protein
VRLTKQQKAYQLDQLEIHGMDQEFKPSKDLVGVLIDALQHERNKSIWAAKDAASKALSGSNRTSDLIVLDKMCERGRDIRMARLPENYINCRRVKAGGQVTIGVDDASAGILMNMALGDTSYGAALIIFRRDQFEEIKAELKGSS